MLIRPWLLAFTLALLCLASAAEQPPVQWSGEAQLDLTEGVSARLVSTRTASDAAPTFDLISDLALNGYHPTGTLLQFRPAFCMEPGSGRYPDADADR